MTYWFAIIIQLVWVPLILTLAYYYVCLMYTLKKAFSAKMQKEKSLLTKVFGLMLIALIYRLVYSIPLGYYYLWICGKVLRTTLQQFN